MDRTADLPFREKEAWITLAAMATAYGGYFWMAAAHAPENSLRFILWFAIATVARVAIQFGGRWVAATATPLDARAPADERDRRIAQRGMAAAYGTLLVAMILVAVVMPLSGSTGWEVANAALFGIVLAETVSCAVVIAGYRGAWNG